MKRIIFILVFLWAQFLHAQILIRGTVYDISKTNYVSDVRVVSTGGMFSITDSMGRYSISVNLKDSLYFEYLDKPTRHFPVSTIQDRMQFDIALNMPVKSKYSVLSEVKVFTKSYRQDSIENREKYADIFGYEKPGLESSMSPGGVPGADLGALINIFRFKRNRQLRSFQNRLIEQEEEKYVNHRFSKHNVSRITGLMGIALDTFIVQYRPGYEFTREADELTFNNYVLQAYYHFQRMQRLSPAIKKH